MTNDCDYQTKWTPWLTRQVEELGKTLQHFLPEGLNKQEALLGVAALDYYVKAAMKDDHPAECTHSKGFPQLVQSNSQEHGGSL